MQRIYFQNVFFEAIYTDDGISRSSACEAFAQVEDVQERNELYELMELVPNHRNALYLYYYGCVAEPRSRRTWRIEPRTMRALCVSARLQVHSFQNA